MKTFLSLICVMLILASCQKTIAPVSKIDSNEFSLKDTALRDSSKFHRVDTTIAF
jgi:hypothetical protein